MFSEKQIVFEPDYKKIVRSIISEYSNIDDYNNDNNDYFNNINIIFYTKTKPDSIYSTVHTKNKYFISMTIDKIREIVKKCYDADPFSNELIVNIVRYLPETFFSDLNLNINFKNKKYINIQNPIFNPNNRDKVIILDNLDSINDSINIVKNKFDIYDYELRRLFYITIRMNVSKNFINKISDKTSNNSDTCFLLKDNKNIVFEKIPLNTSLSKININRQNSILTLYNATKDESFLSNDVLYKFILTKNIYDWSNIFENNIDFFEKNNILKELSYYKNIYRLL